MSNDFCEVPGDGRGYVAIPGAPPLPFPFSNKHGSHPRLMQTSSEPGRPEGVILSKRDLDSWVQTPALACHLARKLLLSMP
ncbi:hypothetical protein CEXT_655931 [Caerostris extrusa]|uniref:Uncharacterized protein n=1 Tax=Caerostris extrusa TaxID=172846 RepID=A0AAV4QTS0_CAEEX|nr:hypothetical protein CEXT_655931 [Caerostris extrusa]